ncbi:MAG: DUF421 domain-containing protein [Mucilaginibacter sp.]
MQSQDIHLKDWLRILIGEVPPSYFLELLIRAAAVYFILMLSMRSMGKRMSSQLSRNELAALVSLAAAVGIPMMSPERGLLAGAVIAFILISVQRLIAKLCVINEKFESYSQGKFTTLVNAGVVDMKALNKVNLSHERVFSQLRAQGILQLGTVARFYLEASGNFTLMRHPRPSPGLSVLPPWDEPLRDCFTEHPDKKVCIQCGLLQKKDISYLRCPNCGQSKWVVAVTER